MTLTEGKYVIEAFDEELRRQTALVAKRGRTLDPICAAIISHLRSRLSDALTVRVLADEAGEEVVGEPSYSGGRQVARMIRGGNVVD